MDRKTPPPEFDVESITPPYWVDKNWQVMSMAIDLSGDCNMACRYCAESATQPQRAPMTPETLQAAWSFLFPKGAERGNYNVRLGSGEPLLGFDLMKQIEALAKKAKDGGPPVYLTTNGTLVDDDVIEWLVQSGWNIKISFDGPQWVQDKWRVFADGSGTHKKVSSVIKSLVARIPERVSVTAVMCKGTDPAVAFAAIEQLGVTQIEMVPAVHQDESVRPGIVEVEQYRAFINHYAARFLHDENKALIPKLARFKKCVQRIMGYSVSRINCGAGRDFMGVDPEGNLFPCFRFIGIPEYKIGNIYEGVTIPLRDTFRSSIGRPVELREPCNQCWAALLCGGPCFAVAEMFGPGDGKPLDIHCEYVLADATAAVGLVNELREKDPELLLSFLPFQKLLDNLM